MKTKERITYFLVSLVGMLILTRIYLHFLPNANINVGNYNIHHIYLGTFLLILSVILLILNNSNKFIFILSGISTALIIDQVPFLIFTDATDSAYFSYFSLIGAFVLAAIITIIILVLYLLKVKK